VKIDVYKVRTHSNPFVGVTLSAAEKREANDVARTLTGVPFDALYIMRKALAVESVRLEAAAEWTGTDNELVRRAEHERCLSTWYAVDLACHRTNW
jgi:hypothetical protein